MTTSKYRLLAKVAAAPPSLADWLRTVVFAAGHVAAGDSSSAVEAFRSMPEDVLPKAYDLAVLQSVAFVGFPRVLTAAAALKQAGFFGSRDGRTSSASRSIHDREAGEATFEQIYGRAESKVRSRIASFHPLLEDWVIQFGYGQVLSNPGPDLRERELCAIGVLTGGGQGTEPLLISHIRGALRVGATAEEVRAVLDHTQPVHGDLAAEHAEAVFSIFERSRAVL
jgi:alkylhydroperoxidase/carboxymuconolactone decarboxylase family protein YurZ